MARSSKELESIADVILHHHERWDGKGYPDGLDRESIPRLARVIAVVDAYDAMTHTRVYRKSMSINEALKELKACAGSQFDPGLVTEFIKIIVESVPARERAAQAKHAAADNETPTEVHVPGCEPVSAKEDGSSKVHGIPCTKCMLDEELNLLSEDREFERITGYQKGELTNIVDLIPKDDRTEWLMEFNRNTANQKSFILEHYIRTKDGKLLYMASLVRHHFNAVQKANRIDVILVNTDDTYGKRRLEQLEQERTMRRMKRWEDRYRRDSLTGLLSHDPFVNDVEEHLLKKKDIVLMIMMDVDYFKQFNDSFGHHRGDELLQTAAHALSNSIRSTDLAGRMGGDEFAAALFFPLGTEKSKIRNVVHDLFRRVSAEVAESSEGMTISMGASVSDAETQNFVQLYESADHQLYESKNAGRGRLSDDLKKTQ